MTVLRHLLCYTKPRSNLNIVEYKYNYKNGMQVTYSVVI